MSILGSSVDSAIKRRIDFSKSIQSECGIKVLYKPKDAQIERISVNQYESNNHFNLTASKEMLNCK